MYRFIHYIICICLLAATPLAAGTEEQLDVKCPQQAATLTYQTMENGNLLVSAIDKQEKPILGLKAEDFSIHKGLKTAKILSVESLATSKEVGLNIVMVIDNSQSMRMRNAVQPLTRALEAFYKTVRPIDEVCAVVFDEKQTVQWNGRTLHAKILKTNEVPRLRSFVAEGLTEGLTNGTYLYDAMVFGLAQARSMPEKSNKFMVVFSDGQDINSAVKSTDVEKEAMGIANFSVYAVDYMPGKETDKFLETFSHNHTGRTWKAGDAASLLPVFESFSSTLLHRYIISYRFLEAPTGTVAFSRPELTIEEVTTIDSAPMLNYIFFDTGQSELSSRYTLLKRQDETRAFAEENLKGPLEKYRHVLNIIGKRLSDNPDATVRLVGCNSDIGDEKGRSDLSLQRAEAVRAYLQYVWNVGTPRMLVENRNLPAVPSSNRSAEGQAENQRVEIYSDNPAILNTVNSEYVQKVSDQKQLQIVPEIKAEAGLADWKVTLHCGQKTIRTFEGQGNPPEKIIVPLEAALLEQMTTCDSIRSSIQATDKETNVLKSAEEGSLAINFLQRKEQMAQVQGYKVKEQYALILFDYNSAEIKERNQAVVERIVQRIRQVPDALVSVVGHTDILGSEEYNMDLSRKRAEAVQAQIIKAASSLAGKLHVSGVGPNAPLFDNNLPEGRALNRTVTITLEYLKNPSS